MKNRIKVSKMAICIIICALESCRCVEDHTSFFINWDRLSRYGESITGLLYIGIEVDTSPRTDCKIHGRMMLGPGYEGYLSYQGGKVMMHDSNITLPVPLFDFSMQPGDSVIVERKMNSSLNSDNTEALLKFRIVLHWKKLDTCLSDTVFMFQHSYDSYSPYQAFEDEVYFLTKTSGPVGWAEGKFTSYGDYAQYIEVGVGRLYFAKNELALTEAKKRMLNLIKNQNVYHCLE